MAAFDPIDDETPIDISGLIPRAVRSRKQLNVVEARNILKAQIQYLSDRPSIRQAPFTAKWSLKLHDQMFGEVWAWAGTLRRGELNVGVPTHRVETDLYELFDDLAYWRKLASMELIEQATRLHHRAVLIHPFLNGNGRWARLLANIYLKQQRHPLVVWPDETIGQTSIIRSEYIAAIKAADAGDYQPLLAMHRRYSVEGG